MAIYIRFENGKQVETAELAKSPGADWVKAPATFSWDTPYRLTTTGKVTAMSATAIAQATLADMKPQKKAEIKALADNFRTATYTAGQPKNDEYRIKADAARRLLELEDNNEEISTDNLDYQLLNFEAEVREITPVELARQIVEKSNETLQAVGIIAGFEAKGKKIIEEAAALEALEKDLEALITETEKKLNLV